MSSREETNESGLQKKRGLRIVNKWISFDSPAYVQEFWRWPDLLERK